MEKIIHVKAFMDHLRHEEGYEVLDKIVELIPNDYDDDVFEFDVVLKNIKNISEEVGVDGEGCRAFRDVEVEVQ